MMTMTCLKGVVGVGAVAVWAYADCGNPANTCSAINIIAPHLKVPLGALTVRFKVIPPKTEGERCKSVGNYILSGDNVRGGVVLMCQSLVKKPIITMSFARNCMLALYSYFNWLK